jgi:hypothetical protein
LTSTTSRSSSILQHQLKSCSRRNCNVSTFFLMR